MRLGLCARALAALLLGACQAEITLPPASFVDAGVSDAAAADAALPDAEPAD